MPACPFQGERADWRSVVDINLNAVIHGTRLATRAMLDTGSAQAPGRGLHSSSLRLNLSAFCVTGLAVRGCFGGVWGGGGVFRVCFCVRNGSS